MAKFAVLFALISTLTLSGCCQLFGICTSASVHTSISSPQQYATEGGIAGPLGIEEASAIAQAPFQSGICPD